MERNPAKGHHEKTDDSEYFERRVGSADQPGDACHDEHDVDQSTHLDGREPELNASKPVGRLRRILGLASGSTRAASATFQP